MIAAPVQGDVDGIAKRSHFARVPPMRLDQQFQGADGYG
jgi:hypothetical protein